MNRVVLATKSALVAGVFIVYLAFVQYWLLGICILDSQLSCTRDFVFQHLLVVQLAWRFRPIVEIATEQSNFLYIQQQQVWMSTFQFLSYMTMLNPEGEGGGGVEISFLVIMQGGILLLLLII